MNFKNNQYLYHESMHMSLLTSKKAIRFSKVELSTWVCIRYGLRSTFYVLDIHEFEQLSPKTCGHEINAEQRARFLLQAMQWWSRKFAQQSTELTKPRPRLWRVGWLWRWCRRGRRRWWRRQSLYDEGKAQKIHKNSRLVRKLCEGFLNIFIMFTPSPNIGIRVQSN